MLNVSVVFITKEGSFTSGSLGNSKVPYDFFWKVSISAK